MIFISTINLNSNIKFRNSKFRRSRESSIVIQSGQILILNVQILKTTCINMPF